MPADAAERKKTNRAARMGMAVSQEIRTCGLGEARSTVRVFRDSTSLRLVSLDWEGLGRDAAGKVYRPNRLPKLFP